MWNAFILVTTPARSRSFGSIFRHLGIAGLFFLSVLGSSPLPTLGGPDILIAILAGSHGGYWYYYASVATAGSVIGAYITFRIAHKAGSSYLKSKFGEGRVAVTLKFFKRWGTGTLAASTAIPGPFPTGIVYAVAGASNYRLSEFLAIVTICRAARYSGIAFCAVLYGRHFVRVLRHPMQYWGWFSLFTVLTLGLIAAGILFNRRFATASAASVSAGEVSAAEVGTDA